MRGLLDRVRGRSAGVADICTARLRLRAITPAMLAAESVSDPTVLARLLQAQRTTEWPPEHWEPHVWAFIAAQDADLPNTRGYHRYVLLQDVRRRQCTLIGAVGAFPKQEGDVEIGYSTLPAFQRQGYGTEAAQALVQWLLTRPEVQSVSAQTYPHLPESIKVMERCGMLFAGDGDDPGTVRYRRLR